MSDATDQSEESNVEYKIGKTDLKPDEIGGDADELYNPENLDPEPVPDESACPYCGGDPTDESQVLHKLSAIGYRHDDQELTCSECDRTWLCGVPIGSYDGAKDLFCPSCNSHRMLPHRIELEHDDLSAEEIYVHLKCPNCFHFRKTTRETDGNSVALLGYPSITGDIDGAREMGYDAERPPGAD